MGGYGQSITAPLCCSFLLMLFPCTSLASLHSRQSFENCSSMGPHHTAQFLRENLLSVGSTSHSSCQETALAWTLHGLQLSSGSIHLFWCGVLHELQCEYLLHCRTPWAAGTQPASQQSAPWAAGESLL